MIVVAEYLTGIMLARPTSRPRLQLFIDHVLETVAVLPYDEEILDTHVALRAWTYQDGRPRGQHDLIIAATAVVTGRTLLTLDHKAKFDELPGLTVEYPQGR
jgi:tRNA(fMet)-specific endonuclease VapC